MRRVRTRSLVYGQRRRGRGTRGNICGRAALRLRRRGNGCGAPAVTSVHFEGHRSLARSVGRSARRRRVMSPPLRAGGGVTRSVASRRKRAWIHARGSVSGDEEVPRSQRCAGWLVQLPHTCVTSIWRHGRDRDTDGFKQTQKAWTSWV